jgi:hypothetical protein
MTIWNESKREMLVKVFEDTIEDLSDLYPDFCLVSEYIIEDGLNARVGTTETTEFLDFLDKFVPKEKLLGASVTARSWFELPTLTFDTRNNRWS